VIPIRFIVRIAEQERIGARLEDQREVDHPAGIARIKRPAHQRFVRGEGARIDPDTQRKRKNGDGSEPRIAEEHADSVTQVLEQGVRQDHPMSLPHVFLSLKFIP